MADRIPQNFGEVLLGSLGKGLGYAANALPQYNEQKRLSKMTEANIQNMIEEGRRRGGEAAVNAEKAHAAIKNYEARNALLGAQRNIELRRENRLQKESDAKAPTWNELKTQGLGTLSEGERKAALYPGLAPTQKDEEARQRQITEDYAKGAGGGGVGPFPFGVPSAQKYPEGYVNAVVDLNKSIASKDWSPDEKAIALNDGIRQLKQIYGISSSRGLGTGAISGRDAMRGQLRKTYPDFDSLSIEEQERLITLELQNTRQ